MKISVLLSIFLATLVVFNPIEIASKGILNKLFPAKKRKHFETKNSYPYPDKELKDLDEMELLVVLDWAKKNKNKDFAFKVYYNFFSVCRDHTKLKTYKLDLADYCYSFQDYEKASVKYEEFCILYPGCDEAEYAEYKLILCTFFTSLQPHRDQTDTVRTINFIAHFLQKAKQAQYIDEAKNILKTCRKRLLEHEVIVFEMNLKQKKFVGAQKRLEYITNNFNDIEHIEKYIEYLQKIYDQVKNPDTCPFYFKINIEDALLEVKEHKKKQITKQHLKKTVSYFAA